MQKKKPQVDISFEQASIGRERAGLRARLLKLERATALHAHSFLLSRWDNLRQVRRFAVAWIIVAAILVGAGWWQISAQQSLFSKQGPAEGGSYIEGVVGEIETLSPVFATNNAERSVSKLLFATLLHHDAEGRTSGNLAESWSISTDGRVYTVKLRPDLRWSDGKPITSEDVLFTVNTIQNPAARSPLLSAWQNVGVEAQDERTVSFTLEVPFAPFLNTLNLGIIPAHTFNNVQPEQLRSARESSKPTVTSGPFAYRGTVGNRNGARSEADVYLTRNDAYHLGAPKLERYTLRTYEDGDSLVAAMRDREIMAASDIPYNTLHQFDGKSDIKSTEIDLFGGVFAFFKTSVAPLDDKNVRVALREAVNLDEITSKVGGGVSPMTGPLLKGQLGFVDTVSQSLANPTKAEEILDKAGWARGDNGVRIKDDRPLRLRLVSLNSGEYSVAVQELQRQWEAIGVQLEVELVQPDEFQSSVITPHAYDVLVYELGIGRDSDVYPFWHSSQAEPGRLNLSEYQSSRADEALESSRTALDSRLRDVKYRTFVEQWLADTPAIALYRPTLHYVQLSKTQSVEPGMLGEQLDRLSNVLYWTADTEQLNLTR